MAATPAEDRLRLRVLPARTAVPDALRGFATPIVREALEEGPYPSHAVAAYRDGEPVGLAAGLGGRDGQWELASLFVTPFSRHQGIGRALLDAVEAHFFGAGYRLAACLLSVAPDDLSRTRFLRACGWGAPQVKGVLCRSTMALALQTPWLVRAEVPAQYRVVPWMALSADQREALRAGGWESDNPQVDPFQGEAGCEPATSLALLRRAERPGGFEPVVGWTINHAIDDRTLRWTISFVRPSQQASGLILPLWHETVKRQHELTAYPEFSFASEVSTPRMVRFAQRRMHPWLSELRYSCAVLKEVPP